MAIIEAILNGGVNNVNRFLRESDEKNTLKRYANELLFWLSCIIVCLL